MLFEPGYVDDLAAVTDEQVQGGALDPLVPGLDGQWPEPRAMWQDEVFYLRDRTRIDVAALGPVRVTACRQRACASSGWFRRSCRSCSSRCLNP